MTNSIWYICNLDRLVSELYIYELLVRSEAAADGGARK